MNILPRAIYILPRAMNIQPSPLYFQPCSIYFQPRAIYVLLATIYINIYKIYILFIIKKPLFAFYISIWFNILNHFDTTLILSITISDSEI